MKTLLDSLSLLFLVTLSANPAFAQSKTVSWWLISENIEELPLEIQYDTSGIWDELWIRDPQKPQAPPRQFMEQTLGARWMGMGPDSLGKPSRAVLIYNEKYIVEISADKTRTGKLENGTKIFWSDGVKENLEAFKKARGRRKRSRGAKKVRFGKITLPPLNAKTKEISPLALKGLNSFLNKASVANESSWGAADNGLVTRLSDGGESLLKLRYSSNCKEDEKEEIENILELETESKLSCWASQNPEKSTALFSALLQKPELRCKYKFSGEGETCGKASLAFAGGFFISTPAIDLDMSKCSEELNGTLLHEILHLAGVKDGEEMDTAIAQANSCTGTSAEINFEGSGEEFFNDLQVETRVLLFKKVREEAKEKWGWSEAEESYVLGAICSKMEDKFCARRYFQIATESGGGGEIILPEGGEVSFSAAAHFGLFDSISEDTPRMHELVRYLSRDPNGKLLRRLESGTHRMHEYFAARTALEKVKENKGVCSSEIDDRVACEDLAQIIKSPWFKN